MSEYRLFKVIRTDEQKYFDIEYVRDVVTCRECIHCADDWIDVGMGTMSQFTCELGRCGESVQPNDFCSYGEPKEKLKGSERLVKGSEKPNNSERSSE